MGPAVNPNVKALTPKRALLDEIDYLNRNVYGLQNAQQLPGYIRSEVILGTQNSIQFPIRTDEQVNGQPVNGTENRLNINDAFFITHYSVMFYTFATAEGAAGRAVAPLQTFPNDKVFPTEFAQIEGAYNGKLALRVDNTVYIDSMDMNRFKNIGTAQQGTALSTVALAGITSGSQWSQGEAFANEVDPLVRLNGPGKNLFTVTLPDTLDFTNETESIVAVLYLRGWLSQNGGGFRSAGR